jgi:hypothetical protein
VSTPVSTAAAAWLISPTLTGWKMQFQDVGHALATNAGVHRSVDEAKAEARR